MKTTIISDDNPDVLLVQPVDSHDLEEMEAETKYLREHSEIPFRLVAVCVDKWFDELAPWPAPPVFGKTPFGNGAGKTLDNIMKIIEEQKKSCPSLTNKVLGGYSLAGLFALWSGTQQHFDGIVAASPSVWYKDWIEFSERHPALSPNVYLSLGDKEYHSKTPVMASVNERIHQQFDILKRQGLNSVLEMNPGNHFQDNGIRMAKGFAWAMDNI